MERYATYRSYCLFVRSRDEWVSPSASGRRPFKTHRLILLIDASTMATPTKIKIQAHDSDPSVDPVVVSFPGGVPEESMPKFTWKKNPASANKRGRLVVGRDETCVYRGQSDGMGYDGRRTKLCVGVLNKRTGKLEVYPAAERGTVFTLEQSVPSYRSTLYAAPRQLTASQRRKALFEDFGSQKKRRVLKSQEANVVDSVVGGTDLVLQAMNRKSPGDAANMSESNRKAMEKSKRGTKVSSWIAKTGMNLMLNTVLLTPHSYFHCYL